MLTKEQRIERFWNFVERIPFHSCWEWSAYVHWHGYGGFRSGDNKSVYAHRFSWEIHNGPIPDKLHVLHKCDNRTCVNPAHLFLGDQALNMKDKVTKGRQNRGNTHWNKKLTEIQVLKIRKLRAEQNLSYKKLGQIFKVSPHLIRRVCLRERWKHI